jgi:CDP-glycerol glycerophosphotransferase
MKKITVVIPIYNTEDYLQESVRSVINQTYPNIEILLINDGSTDSCKELIEKLSKEDKRIRSYHFTSRKGVGASRNLGIDKATGDYLYFLDSDDYLPHRTLESLIERIGEFDILSGEIKNITKKEEENLKDVKIELMNQTILDTFKNNSILNRLISLAFTKKHNLRFSEDVDCFSDMAFITQAIIQLKEAPCLSGCFYYKRTRNDPISNPSLLQLSGEKKTTSFLELFLSLKETYSNTKVADRFLDEQFITFYRKEILMLFTNQKYIKDYFDTLSHAVRLIKLNSIPKSNLLIKQQLASLCNGRQKQYMVLIKTYHGLRDVKGALSGRRKFYIFLYQKFLTRIPLKEKTIVFESFLGKNYSDSPKNIYEYMTAHKMDFNYVWIFNEKKEIPGNAKQVKRYSFSYYYYLATSKYWVSNSRIPMHLNKRPGNVYLQTWHGTPLKKLVFDMNEIFSANPNYKTHFYKQSRRWDYLISANQYSSNIFRRAFKYEKELLEFGYPRNDILHAPDKDIYAKNIKQKLNLPLNKKVILYAPTWRDDDFYEPGKYKFNLKLNLQKMKERLGNEYVVLLRMHYFIADNIETTGVEDFAFNLSKYNDIADLYLISDMLITDYSSVFFDYANLKRPILFYTYDLEKYRDTLRGFYINMEEEVPGPLLETTEEIIDSIENINIVKENYQLKYDHFYEKFCAWEKGTATKQVVEKVFTTE